MVHSTIDMMKKFLRDERAAVTVEFVIALPLLLAMMIFAVQYGNAIRVRNALDSATRDAARFLARTPLNSDGSLDIYFIVRAQELVSNQIGNKANNISVQPVVSSESATVNISAEVPFPLLRMTGLYDPGQAFITMRSTQFWRRTGTAVVTSTSNN